MSLRNNHIKIIILLIIGAVVPLATHAQVTAQSDYAPQPYSSVAIRIDQDFQQNKISHQDALLYQFYSEFDPSKLPARYLKVESSQSQPVKCFTPAVVEYELSRKTLSKSTQNIINHYLTSAGSGDNQIYMSPSGKFKLYYTTDPSSPDAVPTADANNDGIPDYVEWAGQYADSVYDTEVKIMGFSDPIPDTTAFVIRFARLGNDNSPTYGYTYINSQGNPEMKVHCDFALSGFPPNTDPDGKVKGDLKVTIAHEFKHAIQYIDDGWSGESARWLEMDAVMMEEAVFDTVNDYYNYLKSPSSIFNNPQYSIYPGSYYQVTFALYYLQKYGIGFWRKVWAYISRTNDSYINSMTYVLENDYNATFPKTFVESELWHYASGHRSPADYGFQERMNYPTSRVIHEYDQPPSGFSLRLYSNRLSANYQEIVPGSSTGPVMVSLYSSSNQMDVGLLATFKDGSTKEIIQTTHPETGQIHIQTPWSWENLSDLGIVTANVSSSTTATSRLLVGDNDVLYGDYNEDGFLDKTDVNNILSNIAINGDTYIDQLVGSDLSGDGTISTYDASLIMRHLDGSDKYFAKDSNHDNYGPETDVYSAAKSVTGNPATSPADPVDLQLDKGDTTASGDNPLVLKLNNQSGHHFSSFVVRLALPAGVINSVTFDTTGSVWHNAQYQTYYDQNVFSLAIAEADSFSTGTLGTLHISASKEADVVISVAGVSLDEYSGRISVNSLNYHIMPKTTVAIEKPVLNIPDKTELSANYPNPFNPTTNINYSLSSRSKVTLEIYNILGQRVAQLVNSEQAAGTYHYEWSAASYSSGTYLYRIIAHSSDGHVFVQTRKMLLIK